MKHCFVYLDLDPLVGLGAGLGVGILVVLGLVVTVAVVEKGRIQPENFCVCALENCPKQG